MRPSDPWELGWESIASLGTAMAALLAVIAIIISARAAKASARAAEAAEAQLAAQTMPVVVEVPLGGALPDPEVVSVYGAPEVRVSRKGEVAFSVPEQGRDPALISIPVQNIGSGLAEVRDAVLLIGNEAAANLLPGAYAEVTVDEEGNLGKEERSPVYLAPQGRDRLGAVIWQDAEAWKLIREEASRGDYADITVRIEFADVTGRRRYETNLSLYQLRDDARWRLVRLNTAQKHE